MSKSRLHRHYRALLLACLLAFANSIHAAPDTLLRDALDTYANAQSLQQRDERLAAFARSAQLFAQAAREGAGNAEVLANAGTAALQAERIGDAIVYLRLAISSDPDNARAQRNIREARTLIADWVPKPGQAGGWQPIEEVQSLLAPRYMPLAAALLFLAACLFTGLSVLAKRAAWLWFAGTAAAAWSALMVSTYFAAPVENAVLSSESIARAADSHNSPARYAQPLPAGTEVTVVEKRGEWVRATLADEVEIWLRASALARLSSGPP
ncbi:MAG: hypothetical protein GKR94_28460 [Gammaproteobacteria bacterium]|nr:hypothetical protein [Gammaproteobacteria bacterium]